MILMVKKIIIQFDDDHEPEDTIRRVAELVEEGYTSGCDPNWEICNDEE